MSSVALNKTNGTRRILFTNAEGKRKTLYLGKLSKRDAQGYQTMVDAIVNDQRAGRTHDADVERWIKTRSAVMRRKLEALKLVEAENPKWRSDLYTLCFGFITSSSVKPSTVVTYAQTAKALRSHFGDRAMVVSITPESAEMWRQHQLKTLAKATVSKRVKTARLIFAKAVEWGIIERNPFKNVKAGGETNPDRLFFVDEATMQKVMAAITDPHFRLVVALSRYGGLRCPSEHAAMRWEDVDFLNRRIIVREHKTKARTVPLFAQVEAAFDLIKKWGTFGRVFPHTLTASTNLRRKLERLLTSIGIKPWPRLFHNMRASRQTELVERHPAHVVCKWLGNSERIARDHYLQVRDEDFLKAIRDSDQETTQKTTQPTADNGGQLMPTDDTKVRSSNEKRGSSKGTALESDPDGNRALAKSPGKRGRRDEYDAENDAIPNVERMRRALAVIAAASGKMFENEGAR